MMSDTLGSALAARFREDAQALRARANALEARGGARGHGPDAATCRKMADACDRVSALFESAGSIPAPLALAHELERLLAAERSPDVRHVYEGAAQRLRAALGAHDVDDMDEEDEEDDADE